MTEPNKPNEPVTETAETVAGPGDKSTDSSDLAWSLDTEETPTHDHRWRGPVTSAALVTLLCLIVAVVTWFSVTYYREQQTRPAPKQTAPPTVTVTPTPPPTGVVGSSGRDGGNGPTTATVTVTPAPSAVPSTPSATDKAFWADLESKGISIPTGDAAEYAVENAHRVCDYIATNRSLPGALYFVETTTIYIDAEQAKRFIVISMGHYCGNLAQGPTNPFSPQNW